MGTINEQSVWHDEIYQVEKTNPIQGGEPVFIGNTPTSGFANAGIKQLADRTSYLRDETIRIDQRVINGTNYSVATLADLQAITDPGEYASGVVNSDPDPTKNGDYYWDASIPDWVYSENQRATTQQFEELQQEVNTNVDNVRLTLEKTSTNFKYSPYLSFDDGINLEIVDENGYKIGTEQLIETIRNSQSYGKNISSPYLSFDDDKPFEMVDREGRVLVVGGSTPLPPDTIPLWNWPVHLDYTHASKDVRVSWIHDKNIMLRTWWCPNGHNSLFNFRAIYWAPIGDPETATWNGIQYVGTDYIPPITFFSNVSPNSSNVGTTGGNHAGKDGELTAIMDFLDIYINDVIAVGDFKGFVRSVGASWSNRLFAGNTVNEQRYTLRQDMRVKFYQRTVEVASKVTALESIRIFREGGTQMVGTGWNESYHFYGGRQHGPIIPSETAPFNPGTKSQAPEVWACVLKSPTLGFAASWIDRTYGVKWDLITPNDYPAQKNAGTYKFYNYTVKNETNQHYMEAGDTYQWRGGYSYSPLNIVDGLDSAFLFIQNGKLRIGIANSDSQLNGSVILPNDVMSTDFETIGGLDSIGTYLTFNEYTAKPYKELN